MGLIKDFDALIIPNGNFQWWEYATLRETGELMQPTEWQYNNALFLFGQLQPLRRELGRALYVTSGARNPAYTRLLRRKGVNASIRSAHNEWRGVDLQCPGMPIPQLWHWFHRRWQGRMELLEYTPTWIHLDTRNWGKRERFKP